MKKILVVLLTLACVFTISIPAFAAQKTFIPFWQNGGNVTTLISIVSGDGTAAGLDGGSYASTGAGITITLTRTDTSAGYTIHDTAASSLALTSGEAFATAKLVSYRGKGAVVDTSQIGGTAGTVIWTTGTGYSATAARFGHGVVDIGTARSGDHKGWVAVYGGTNPAGFTVDLSTL